MPWARCNARLKVSCHPVRYAGCARSKCIDKLPSVRDAMDVVATSHAPFVMRLGGVGCFPNARRPRVVWVGLAEEEARLVSLKAALDASLAPLDWTPDDKPFRAHLTLGRVKDERGVQGVDWAKRSSHDPDQMILPPALAQNEEAAIDSLGCTRRLSRVADALVVEVNAAALNRSARVSL
ncbi:MAG: hypothetical protein DCC51_14360 [Anaerolineae bacterium]|nr:MAG: hypothetical protein DCC51_14360 [Anaerolineae bacterium]